MTEQAVLITRSCTTGWTDWIHGELWILPTALVRRRLDYAETRANALGPTVDKPLPDALPGDFNHSEILRFHPTNKVILFEQIAKAALHQGRTSDRLTAQMHDGTRHKLLWLSRDPAYSLLSATLSALLGARLVHSNIDHVPR